MFKLLVADLVITTIQILVPTLKDAKEQSLVHTLLHPV